MNVYIYIKRERERGQGIDGGARGSVKDIRASFCVATRCTLAKSIGPQWKKGALAPLTCRSDRTYSQEGRYRPIIMWFAQSPPGVSAGSCAHAWACAHMLGARRTRLQMLGESRACLLEPPLASAAAPVGVDAPIPTIPTTN